ncbi:hypothetical protein G6F70_004797 [Rhizopus microsporus]|uniref:Uncharacterized protein n=1 Tax=Rhizopus microsporus TaxID=58291 RepID=A0A1X0RWS1_RHIZD|nr:hypothetical protein G6F71_006014 [Rhizopus microsporus]KAG1199595.1 hypothetical protein G6F70_004797 [Rhizopus microsporus]KAG1213212.1 hypothetical protein G6F69_003011 [Rhizopus microsporus]KAG1233413.1 hypothetical protein G6F67_004279 [Rhizopus microsporus]KAG1265421.1 hypothetical protein G6F68_003601 [Rhizopus microsporus]
MADESHFRKYHLTKNSSVKSDNSSSSRKFRWSSCFSFVTNKLKRYSKLNTSPSFEALHALNDDQKEFSIQDSAKLTTMTASSSFTSHNDISSSQWKEPTSSLLPPPRQPKPKRQSIQIPTSNKDRIPLIDPTLTPKVKPKSAKGQPTLLRLSLDAECLQSPTQSIKDDDNESVSTGYSGSTSNHPTPFRSGTLGATKPSSDLVIPPLPSRPTNSSLDSWLTATEKPLDSCISVSAMSQPEEEIDLIDESRRLSLKERRRRKSPLTLPGAEQLTLAIKETKINENEDHTWRHQLVEQSVIYSFRDKYRQEAMLSLEGKRHQEEKSLDNSKNKKISSKSRRSSHIDQPSEFTQKERSQERSEGLEIICEDEIPKIVSRAMIQIPETPPHHQQFTPSLISVPSTPNSIDSSMIDHEEYLVQQHALAVCLSSD